MKHFKDAHKVRNRRDVLKAAASLAVSLPGLAFWPAAALRADDEDSKFFVYVFVHGGWDVTLGSDPKTMPAGLDENDLYLGYGPDEIAAEGALKLGPAAKSLLKHASDLTIVNGVVMSSADNGHPASANYFQTANGQGKRSALALQLSRFLAPCPFGVVYNRNLVKAQDARGVGTIFAEDLRDLRSLNQLAPIFAKMGLSSVAESGYKHAVQRFLANQTKIQEYLRRSGAGEASREATLHQLIATAFTTGCANAAQVDVGHPDDLDTHTAHPGRHLTKLKSAFESVASLFEIFKKTELSDGDSLFSRTTFLITSEFSRLPHLNRGQGKDHNPLANSAILAGHGVKRASVVGSTKVIGRKSSSKGEPMLVSSPFDFKAKKALDEKPDFNLKHIDYIYPENIAATVIKLLDLEKASDQYADYKPVL
ncbi:MAG TPA: DUF1501 domain-containing protein [Bdellovibrionales bacterium]|nr:DUF1501 domain-containing protein [Bdellovibrionales bacterium]